MKDGNHYCGGTEKGLSFLQHEAAWIPYSFLGYLCKPGGTYMSVYFCKVCVTISYIASFPIYCMILGMEERGMY